jgi:hypothetical protein
MNKKYLRDAGVFLFKEQTWRLPIVSRYAENKRDIFVWQKDASGRRKNDKFLV